MTITDGILYLPTGHGIKSMVPDRECGCSWRLPCQGHTQTEPTRPITNALCECCHKVRASSRCKMKWKARSLKGWRASHMNLCAGCIFYGARLKWRGGFFDEETDEFIFVRQLLTLRIEGDPV